MTCVTFCEIRLRFAYKNDDSFITHLAMRERASDKQAEAPKISLQSVVQQSLKITGEEVKANKAKRDFMKSAIKDEKNKTLTQNVFSDSGSERNTSLDSSLTREIQEISDMREYLAGYSGNHAVLSKMSTTLKKSPSWVPTKKERGIFFAVLRQQDRARGVGVTPQAYTRPVTGGRHTRPQASSLD